jgi:pSer/pThr/pTyr-binding forkhead associated (FHA) protein
MAVRCSNCGHSIEESKLPASGDRTSCPKCGSPLLPAASTVPFDDPAAQATIQSHTGIGGVLAENKRYAVVVLEGKNPGEVFQLSNPSVTIGRIQCDIDLDDTEISRQHALITIRGTEATLEDLGSTNGTYVGDDRVQQAALENRSEFRVGNHRLMFVVADRGADLT